MPKIQLAFLLDTTASMQPWINTCKEQIQNVIAETRSKHGEDLEFQVALVAYNDFDETGASTDPIVVPFTSEVSNVTNVLADIVALGGEDAAEDVAGGMRAILDLAWSYDAIWHLVHLADAPPHGRTFHEPWISDLYPNGDPYGRDLEHMLASLDVHYTFFRITENTDVFIKILDEYMGPLLTIVDLQKQTHDRLGVHMRVRELDDHTFSGMLSQVIGESVGGGATANPTSQDDEPADPAR